MKGNRRSTPATIATALLCVFIAQSTLGTATAAKTAICKPEEDDRCLAAKPLFRSVALNPITAFNAFLIGALSSTNSVQDHYAPCPKDDEWDTVPIKIGSRYPGTGIEAHLSKTTPPSENQPSLLTRVASGVFLNIKRVASLGFNFHMWYKERGAPWSRTFNKMKQLPKRPLDFMPQGDPVAGVLTRGPFSVHSVYDANSDIVMLDLSSLDGVQPRKPFVRAGGVAKVGKDPETGLFKTMVSAYEVLFIIFFLLRFLAFCKLDPIPLIVLPKSI